MARRLDRGDLELDEAGLIGATTLESIKASATEYSEGTKVVQAVQKNGILKQIDIEQNYSDISRESR